MPEKCPFTPDGHCAILRAEQIEATAKQMRESGPGAKTLAAQQEIDRVALAYEDQAEKLRAKAPCSVCTRKI
jgi:hypothetical protein